MNSFVIKMSSRPCDAGFVKIKDDCSVESALRSFSSHKRLADKHLGKVYSLMNLLDKQFERKSEENIEELLAKSENQITALLQYSEFLTQKKYEKAKEHLEGLGPFQQKRLQEECRSCCFAGHHQLRTLRLS